MRTGRGKNDTRGDVAMAFDRVSLVTVSASYGAGGSVVAPALAERLGLPFLQRVTTSEGHPAEPGPCDEQLTEEEIKATPVHRLLAAFTEAMPTGPTQSPLPTHQQALDPGLAVAAQVPVLVVGGQR